VRTAQKRTYGAANAMSAICAQLPRRLDRKAPVPVGLFLVLHLLNPTQCSNLPPINVEIFHNNRVRLKMWYVRVNQH
jgi:hypothetical protein